MSQQKLSDLIDDDSRPRLADVWKALDTPIYRVVDEVGVNISGGQLRKLSERGGNVLWLYVDDMDSYAVLDDEDASRLLVVREEEYVPLGWDVQGRLIRLQGGSYD